MRVFCLDVDGVMTDGRFYYTEEGKVMKAFGSDDSDALKLLAPFFSIHFLTADERGLGISRARIERDMGFPISLVPSEDRLLWISSRWNPLEVAYMGDSFMDCETLAGVGLGIAPANASPRAKSVATISTTASGGSGAVAEACFILLGIIRDDSTDLVAALP